MTTLKEKVSAQIFLGIDQDSKEHKLDDYKGKTSGFFTEAGTGVL
jgi:hypothetical protein